jgi:hypothetical protein
MSMHCPMDASHGIDRRATRRLQTGILIFCNRAPIIWHSMRQNTVEASTFGSKFPAMKNAVEQVESLRYKLRKFGLPIEGLTNLFCDNDVQEHIATRVHAEKATPLYRVPQMRKQCEWLSKEPRLTYVICSQRRCHRQGGRKDWTSSCTESNNQYDMAIM